MSEDGVIVWVLGVVFLATLVRSALGFGEALVAVPLLALAIPVEVAAPLAVLEEDDRLAWAFGSRGHRRRVA